MTQPPTSWLPEEPGAIPALAPDPEPQLPAFGPSPGRHGMAGEDAARGAAAGAPPPPTTGSPAIPIGPALTYPPPGAGPSQAPQAPQAPQAYPQGRPQAYPQAYPQPQAYRQGYPPPPAYAQPPGYPQPQAYRQAYPQPQAYAQPQAYPQAQQFPQQYPHPSYPQPSYPQPSYPQQFPPPYPYPGPPRPYVPPRRSRWATVVPIVAACLVVALIVGGNLWGRLTRDPLGPSQAGEVIIAGAGDLPVPGETGRWYPSPGFEEAGAPLGSPAAPRARSDDFAFQEVQVTSSGEEVPVAWSPCRPIHVAVNPAGAPDGFEEHVLDTLGELSVISGLVFVYDGTTDEPSSPTRQSYQPERYGDRWAPVTVQFADPEEIPELRGDVAGLTVSHFVDNPLTGLGHVVSAEVYLDREVLGMPREQGVPAYVSVLRHEFGHVVGLDHVDDPSQLMYPWTSGVVTYQEGDRAGLAELGEGECTRSL